VAIKNYRDLVAWQKAIDIVELVYSITSLFPKEESYILTAQIRRAAISVPANIAEGSSRNSTKEFVRFLNIAMGSLKELETHFEISGRLGLVKPDDKQKLFIKTDEVGRIIYYLRQSLEKKMEIA
jgi:four helix bundle protein